MDMYVYKCMYLWMNMYTDRPCSMRVLVIVYVRVEICAYTRIMCVVNVYVHIYMYTYVDWYGTHTECDLHAYAKYMYICMCIMYTHNPRPLPPPPPLSFSIICVRTLYFSFLHLIEGQKYICSSHPRTTLALSLLQPPPPRFPFLLCIPGRRAKHVKSAGGDTHELLLLRAVRVSSLCFL